VCDECFDEEDFVSGNGQQYPHNPDRVREDMADYIGVVCLEPVWDEVKGGKSTTVRCGGTVWVAETLVVYGVHRFKREDRRFDRQFPAGFSFRCHACGSIMEKRDLEAAGK
jgi:hypothetical protein